MISKQQVYMPYRLGHIGIGLRFLTAEIGHKWVYLRPSTFPNIRRQRVRRDEWDKIVSATEAMMIRSSAPTKRVSR